MNMHHNVKGSHPGAKRRLASSVVLGGSKTSLSLAKQWSASACTVAHLAPSDGQPSRLAYLHISFGPLTQEGLLWGARFWEEGAPEEANFVDWLLLSPLPLSSVSVVPAPADMR